jgi:hypothetical protein
MIPQTTDTGFVQTIERLRIPLITEADQPKQCFYLSHDNLTVTIAIPCSDGNQVCFQFSKIASGEDIEESLVSDILRSTKAGKKLHQGRIDDLLKQLESSYKKEGDAWIRGFRAGTADGWVEQAKQAIITMLVSFTIGLAIGYFA